MTPSGSGAIHIETTNLKQYPYMTRQASSSDAHVVERMRLEQRDVDGQQVKFIVNELVLTDPKVYKMGGSALERLLGDTSTLSQSIAQRKSLSLLLLDPRAQALAESLGSGR